MSSSPKIYRCGELTYTRPQLYKLFFWLMLAGMCIGLANTLPGSILPIQIKELGISDTATWIILSCIPVTLNMTVCPYISVVSDLYRSKWGRRIPFIFASTPPIVLAFVLYAFTQKFGAQLFAWAGPYWKTSPATMTAVVMGLVTFLFQFFAMWINSVIWYIFIDIVPTEFFSRILAYIRLGMTLSSAAFSFFFLKHVEKHATAIFLGAALFYGVSVTLMTIFVKEGSYPPLTPEQLARKNARGIDLLTSKILGLRDFIRVTFCNRLYVYRYLIGVAAAIAGAAGVFNYFLLNKQLDLTNELIGHMNGVIGGISSLGIFLAVMLATLVNRWHPTRIVTYNYVFSFIISVPFLLRWLFGTMPPQTFVMYSIVGAAINLMLNGLIAVSEQPMEMILFPKSRYGTFCAMQAMLRSVGGLLAGFMAARCFDFISAHFAESAFARNFGDGWHYRLAQPWMFFWYLVVAFLAYKVYRLWNQNGGFEKYRPPAPWLPGGKDTIEHLPCHPIRPAAVKKALYLFDACFLAFTILIPLVACWHCLWRGAMPIVPPPKESLTLLQTFHNAFFAGGDPKLLGEYLYLPTACALLADMLWIFIRIQIYRRASNNPEGNGLFQPTLLVLFLGFHALDLLNNFWAILNTPGLFGARLLTIAASSLILAAASIGIIHFMERGIHIPDENAEKLKIPAA